MKKPDNFESPGQALKYFLHLNEWTQEDLSHILSISLKHTNEIIKDKKSLSLDIARLLEKVFEWEASHWMMLDIKYQIANGTVTEEKKTVERKAGIFRHMPINELIKKNWIKPYVEVQELENQVRAFWNIPNNKAIDFTFLENREQSLEYKKSEAFDQFKRNNALVWHQKALNHSRKIKVTNYNRKELLNLMQEIPHYTISENGVKSFLKDLENVGVKFVFLSHLSKTYLDGAAFLSESNPVIALTGRYDRIDNFWFTIAHELSHVYCHLSDKNGSIFIDDTTKKGKPSKKEKEANNMAETFLLSEKIHKHFKNNTKYITEEMVEEFSSLYMIHPSIVVGILAFNDQISYSTLHRFKEPIRDKIPGKYRAEKI